MKASETSLRNLIEGGKQFKIPLYQRPYSWAKKDWETLWDDLISLYHDDIEGNHFLGPIVTLAVPGTPDGISPYVVIDGQQRMTTLSILLLALREKLKGQNSVLAEELHEYYLINKFKEGNAKYKILPTQADREFYQGLVNSKDIPKEGKIYDAYKFFLKKLEKRDANENHFLNLVKLKTIILERLTLVSITLNDDENDNPYLIFESLNYKGSPLTQADLIRNYFFLKLDEKDHDTIYQKYWFPLQQEFKSVAGDKYLEELTLAFWQYLRKKGNIVKRGQIYQVYKQEFEKDKLDPVDELSNLFSYAKYYKFIRFPETENEKRLKRWFKRFKRLEFTTCYPLLLNLYNDYFKNKISLNEFEVCLNYVESYSVRRLLCGMPSNALDKIFIPLYAQISKDDPDNIINNLYNYLNELKGTKDWPDDNMLINSIIEKPVYTDRRNDRIKLILESLAEDLSKELIDPRNLSIEHICLRL